MRALLASTALGIAMICWVTPAFGANEPEPDGSSAMAGMMFFLPTALITVLITFLIYSALRNARSNKLTLDRSVERFEEHRRFTEDHMKRVESQIDLLNNRLSQVVELLTAIGQSPRQDRG
jgi:hypothetical protein